MTVQVSYPGVYVQELASGTRTITGVATSTTAFVGRAARGPVDTAVEIHSQSDYDRIFGGLDRSSPMSFAVRDFFFNGGATAVIVRLFRSTGQTPSPTATITVGPVAAPIFRLIAANPGGWGQNLKARIDRNVSEAAATALGVAQTDIFNLTVEDRSPGAGAVEIHRNLTLVESPRRIDRVLAQDSHLVAWPPAPNDPNASPLVNTTSEPPTGVAAALAGVPSPPGFIESSSVPAQDGTYLTPADFLPSGGEDLKKGLFALEQVAGFNLLVIPPNENPADVVIAGDLHRDIAEGAARYCKKRRAVLILDGNRSWDEKQDAVDGLPELGVAHEHASFAALFFPRVVYANPFNDDRYESFPCAGAVAGIIARIDSERGVWKAPAGLDASLVGVPQLAVELTDMENGDLNQLGVNCLRSKPGVGRVVWGSRTLDGDDRIGSEWKYLPVRRTALFIEESLFRGTEWVVFEPNDDPLWAQIRINVGAFMQGLFLEGAFAGGSPDEAYFVKCDDETTTQADIDRGIVNILVGFAPLKPAEFVIISLQQMAGQTAL